MTDEREHADKDCWCDPLYLRPCTECEAKDEACWMCKGAGVLRCKPTHDMAFAVHIEFEFVDEEDE